MIAPIIPAQPLLPQPSRGGAAGVADGGARALILPPPVVRAVVSTLSRETAAAACAIQMFAAPRRGLRADAGERARFARAYAAGRQQSRPGAGFRFDA